MLEAVAASCAQELAIALNDLGADPTPIALLAGLANRHGSSGASARSPGPNTTSTG